MWRFEWRKGIKARSFVHLYILRMNSRFFLQIAQFLLNSQLSTFKMLNFPMAFNIHKTETQKLKQKKIDELLSTKNLAHIVNKAQLLLRLENILQSVLPDNLKDHCHIMNIKDDVLMIEVDRAAYAMQARFSESDLLYAISEHARIQNIHHLNFCVRPTSLKQTAPEKPLHELSSRSKHAIREAAASIDHPELKAALLKLAE